MRSLIGLIPLLTAGLTIAAHYLRPPRAWLIYLFKPLTTLLILAVALAPGTFLADRYADAIALGLAFSLAGDVWLMLPRNGFLPGLLSFLFAHVCYIVAFLAAPLAPGSAWPLLLLLPISGSLILRYLWPSLPPSLKGPVSLYVAIIALMATLAVSRAMTYNDAATRSAALGALLFFASDAALAIDRFRQPFALAHVVVLGSYFVGQLLIALSVGH
jgi:uncharacterized membrane protein YhhN